MALSPDRLTVQQKNVFHNLRDLIQELNWQAACVQGEARYDLETLMAYVSWIEANHSLYGTGKTMTKARGLIRHWNV